jgi:hypothetical protein
MDPDDDRDAENAMALEAGRQEIRDAVQTLWHLENAWIPAAARRALCQALGVDDDFLDAPNGPRTSNARVIAID